MEKLVGHELPEHPVRNPPHAQPEYRIHADLAHRRQKRLEKKNRDIRRDQNFQNRQPPVLPQTQHAVNLDTGEDPVHPRSGCCLRLLAGNYSELEQEGGLRDVATDKSKEATGACCGDRRGSRSRG